MGKTKIPSITYELTPAKPGCLLRHSPENSQPQYSYHRVFQTIRRFFHQVHAYQVKITGKNPFLFPRFRELVLYCHLKKSQLIISGKEIVEIEAYQELLNIGLTSFEFPFYSYKESIHDFMTGQCGNWMRTIYVISEILAAGADVTALLLITRYNYLHIASTIKYLKKLGVSRLKLYRYPYMQEEFRLDFTQLRQCFAMANHAVNQAFLFASSDICTPFCILNPADYPAILFSTCPPTNTHHTPWTLEPNGNIRFCPYSAQVIGNIYSSEFSQILKNPYLKTLQETIPSFCRQCEKYAECGGGCRTAMAESGVTPRHADPILYS